MIKGYKIRLYPTKEQEELIWKHIHACRFIWNYMLALQQERYKNGEKYLQRFDMIKLLTPLKKQEEYSWLNEVSTTSLQIICSDLNKAYVDFFKKNFKYPKFKSRKKTRISYPICNNRFHFNNDSTVTIQKLSKVKLKHNFIPQGKISNLRISLVNNKWILSFGVECENQVQELTDKSMGIDLGIKELAVVSYGDEKIVFHNINKSKRVRTLEHKLKHVQRVINRKYRTNGNYEKTKGILKYETIAKEINYKLSNIRKNYIHQITHTLTSLLPEKVVMEDLNVSGMMKNKHLAKAIGKQGFYEFIRQMQYKCEWNGIEFIQVDRWYPSSKTCSKCNKLKLNLKLSDRIYKCDYCGLEIDRDYNAAINLMRYVPQVERCAA